MDYKFAFVKFEVPKPKTSSGAMEMEAFNRSVAENEIDGFKFESLTFSGVDEYGRPSYMALYRKKP